MKNGDKPAFQAVRYLEIDVDRAGQRLDNFLVTLMRGVPKSRIYRLVRKGEVRVNRGRAQPDYRLQTGDQVRLPPVRTKPAAPLAKPEGFEWLNDRILHEDDDLIVLDKPAGLAVHGGSGVAAGLIETLRAIRPHTPMLELVHRLDRGTSGCLLIAKRRPILLALHTMLREGLMHKHYRALVRGHWQGGARTIDAPLTRDRVSGADRRVGVNDSGKAAESRFRPIQSYSDTTLVEIELRTGRTHQARVHAAHIDHPIAGDDKYGDWDFNRALRDKGLKRIFLHAAALHFRHPKTGQTLNFEAPLPADLTAVLNRLNEPTV